MKFVFSSDIKDKGNKTESSIKQQRQRLLWHKGSVSDSGSVDCVFKSYQSQTFSNSKNPPTTTNINSPNVIPLFRIKEALDCWGSDKLVIKLTSYFAERKKLRLTEHPADAHHCLKDRIGETSSEP